MGDRRGHPECPGFHAEGVSPGGLPTQKVSFVPSPIPRLSDARPVGYD